MGGASHLFGTWDIMIYGPGLGCFCPGAMSWNIPLGHSIGTWSASSFDVLLLHQGHLMGVSKMDLVRFSLICIIYGQDSFFKEIMNLTMKS